MTVARCSFLSCMRLAARRMIPARYAAVVAAHSSCTATAASIDRRISSPPASGRVAMGSLLAGFVTSKVAPEAAAAVHSPATKSFSITSALIISTSREGVRLGGVLPRHPLLPGRRLALRSLGREEAYDDERDEARQEAAVDRAVGEQPLPGHEPHHDHPADEHRGQRPRPRSAPPEKSADYGHEQGADQQVVGDRARAPPGAAADRP